MEGYKAQLLAVEAKLAKDPDNEGLLTLKSDLMELIEELGEDEEEANELLSTTATNTNTNSRPSNQKSSHHHNTTIRTPHTGSSSQQSSKNLVSQQNDDKDPLSNDQDGTRDVSQSSSRRPLTEAEILARKKEKNKKKKAKLRERMKEQLDIAESEKQSWQSFANKKGLKGITKKSIFASPCSVTGKVGVGTNGIADAPSTAGAGTGSAVPITKRKY